MEEKTSRIQPEDLITRERKREKQEKGEKRILITTSSYNYPPIFIYLATISLLGLKLGTSKDASQNQKRSE